jgi:hypothetical protein
MSKTGVAGFAFLLIVPAAMAVNNRSAVSINGLDTNPCTVASPCRSFGAAITATADGGEVVALDTAGYGPFTINQNVTVAGTPGIHAAITATSGDAISVVGGARVTIANLYILGNQLGPVGIHNTGAASLHVMDCFIQGFASRGIWSTATSAGFNLIERCTLDNNDTGIEMDDVQFSIIDSSINFGIVGLSLVGATVPELGGDVTRTTFRYSDQKAMQLVIGSGSGSFVAVDTCSMLEVDQGIVINSAASQATQGTVIIRNNTLKSLTATGSYTLYTTGTNSIWAWSATATPLAQY